MDAGAQYRQLAADLGVRVAERAPLAPYTWIKIGGPAEFVFFPDAPEKAARLAAELARLPLPVKFLGAGSNLLVADEGIKAAVVATADLRGAVEELPGEMVFAPSGAPVPGLARWAWLRGLAGLEFAEGIPALLGGALKMNAGAHGSSFGAVARELLVADAAGVVARRAVAEGDFGYRASVVGRERLLALGATLALRRDDPPAIEARALEYRRRRQATQPVRERSAGCVFANYPGLPAGKLIDDLGLKGTAVGDAEVSRLHGNFIVNRGAARAADVLALIDLLTARMTAAVGEPPRLEVEVWRDEP